MSSPDPRAHDRSDADYIPSGPFKYQEMDKKDLDAGRPLRYHSPAIKRELAKKKQIAKKMVNGKKVTRKMEHSAKKAGFYKHGDPRFGDIYEK